MLYSVTSVTRRRAIKFLAGTLTTSIAQGNPLSRTKALTSAPPYGLIDALEEHGQWATCFTWAEDVHRSMGAEVRVVARKTVLDIDSAATALGLALQRLILSDFPPDGAVVVIYGNPGVLRLRDAHSAYQMVRSSLRPDAYCAYSPFFEKRAENHITAEVTLGWRIHRAELTRA